MKVNLHSDTTTNSSEEIKFIYKLGTIWEKENQVKSNKAVMYLFSDESGNHAFCDWLKGKGITAEIRNHKDIATVVSIDDSPELTKLLLEA